MGFQREVSADGVDRRGLLKCMAWVGTGLVWTVAGGLPSARLFGEPDRAAGTGMFSFVQISDSHIGFAKPPNTDVVATLKDVVNRINALPEPPAFVLHTGDLTHLAKPAEFDTVAQVLRGVKAGRVLYVPGEHDFDGDDDKLYRERFGPGSRGTGWYSFDHGGVHFVGLVNVASSNASGMGRLGAEQLDWLTKDLAGLAASTPVVVFAHVPLWTVY
jgi:Icc protein